VHIRSERKSDPIPRLLQPNSAALGTGRSDPGSGLLRTYPSGSLGCLNRRTVLINSNEKLSEEAGPLLSGMCFDITELNENQQFSEEFFLDLVDFDWCWRMRWEGWRVFRLTDLIMPNRLGLEQRRFIGVTYHVPAPYRHYFQFRDTLKLIGGHYVPAYSRFLLAGILVPKILACPFILDYGWDRFKWMIKGILDCVYGVRGVGAADRILR